MKRYNYSPNYNPFRKNNRKAKLLVNFNWWLIKYSVRQTDDAGNVSTTQNILPLSEFMYKFSSHYHDASQFYRQIKILGKINPDGIEYIAEPNTLHPRIERNVLLIPVFCPRYGYKWNRKQILKCLNIAPNSTLRILSPYLSCYCMTGELRHIFKKHFKDILREINRYTKPLGEVFYSINITPPKAKSITEQMWNYMYEEMMMISYLSKSYHADTVQ